MRHCVICGEAITGKYSSYRKTCGVVCNGEKHRRYNRDKQREHRADIRAKLDRLAELERQLAAIQ